MAGFALLHLRQTQLAALDLADQFFYCGFCFGHGSTGNLIELIQIMKTVVGQ